MPAYQRVEPGRAECRPPLGRDGLAGFQALCAPLSDIGRGRAGGPLALQVALDRGRVRRLEIGTDRRAARQHHDAEQTQGISV